MTKFWAWIIVKEIRAIPRHLAIAILVPISLVILYLLGAILLSALGIV